MKYMIVEAWTASDLCALVDDRLTNGWHVQGGLETTDQEEATWDGIEHHTVFYQAMVKASPNGVLREFQIGEITVNVE